MKNEKSRFKVLLMEDGTEVMMERHVSEEEKCPAIKIAFFAETEDVSVRIELSHVYKDSDKGIAQRDEDWENLANMELAKEYHEAGMKMFNEAISK